MFAYAGGIIGTMWGERNFFIFDAIEWVFVWTTYLWFIHLPLILGYSLIGFGIYSLIKKVSKQTEFKKSMQRILIFIYGLIPFAFYLLVFESGPGGRF